MAAVWGIFILVDHVLVDRQVHQCVKFFFFEGLAKGGQILAGIAVQIQFVVNDLINVVSILLVIREGLFVGGLRNEGRAENRIVTSQIGIA